MLDIPISLDRPRLVREIGREPVETEYLSRFLIDTRYVDPRNELDSGWLVGVIRSTVDVDTVDPVLVCALVSVRMEEYGRVVRLIEEEFVREVDRG